MTRRRVAIIGAGFSGAAVAAHLAKRGRDAPEVVLIERGKRFGPGLAYGAADQIHLMNVRAARLSAFADDAGHFVRWLGGKHGERFVGRRRFGRYVEKVLSRTGAKRVHGNVTACERGETGWVLTLSDGKKLIADAVVLALGNAPSETPSVFAQAGVDLVDPWDAGAMKRIPRGDVLLLGAGLTMVDAALVLAKQRRGGTIYALSRRGLTPRPHLPSLAQSYAGVVDMPLKLSEALHALRAEVRAIMKRGEPWQHAMDRLRTRTPELWRRLPRTDKLRFIRHLRPWWDVHRHRMAPEIAARIEGLKATGRLRILPGHVVAVEAGGRGVLLQHRQRGSFVRHRLDLAAVVNCTGASSDPGQSREPLVQQMLRDGLMRAHPTGLGLDVDDEGRVIGADGARQDDLFALGPITQGAYWEIIAVPEIRVRASTIAMMLAPDA